MFSLSLSEDHRAQLRTLVADIDNAITHLSGRASMDGWDHRAIGELQVSWAHLLKELALGPTPELRRCPVCKNQGMREATRCGYCWTKLSFQASQEPG